MFTIMTQILICAWQELTRS